MIFKHNKFLRHCSKIFILFANFYKIRREFRITFQNGIISVSAEAIRIYRTVTIDIEINVANGIVRAGSKLYIIAFHS